MPLTETRLNFDANASLGLLPEVREHLFNIIKDPFKLGLNPSSIHLDGQTARAILENARAQLRSFLDIGHEDKIIFTSGASESNNMAITATLFRAMQQKKAFGKILCTAIEHPCVLEPFKRLQRLGFKMEMLHPSIAGNSGNWAWDQISKERGADLQFASVMLANNETGEILPVAEIAKALRRRSPEIIIHSDVAQAVGKIPVSFKELGVDLMSISGHKIGALSGVGALVVKAGIEIDGLIVGGPQEGKLRAGTENTLGIYSLSVAVAAFVEKYFAMAKTIGDLRDGIAKSLSEECGAIAIRPLGETTLPNTLSVRFPDLLATDAVVALDLEGISVSSGAACSSGKTDPSHVLLAMGLEPEEARQAIRISLPPYLSIQEISSGVQKMIETIRRCKEI